MFGYGGRLARRFRVSRKQSFAWTRKVHDGEDAVIGGRDAHPTREVALAVFTSLPILQADKDTSS